MTEEEMRSIIEASAQDAIFFTRVYPPQHDKKPTSFFGGLPCLPPGLEWPVQEIAVDYARVHPDEPPSLVTAEVAPTFLGQIDCRDLPRAGDLELLPRQGVLYFFFASATFELDLPKRRNGKRGTGWTGPARKGDFMLSAKVPVMSSGRGTMMLLRIPVPTRTLTPAIGWSVSGVWLKRICWVQVFACRTRPKLRGLFLLRTSKTSGGSIRCISPVTAVE